MTRKMLVTTVGVALGCATLVVLASLHACSKKVTQPESAEEARFRYWCSDSSLSRDELVIDFRDDFRRKDAEDFASKHSLIIEDTLAGANSYLFAIDRSKVPTQVTANLAGSNIRKVYPGTVLLAEPVDYMVIVRLGDSHAMVLDSFLLSSERLLVIYNEPLSNGLIDSMATAYGMKRVSLAEMPTYVREFAAPFPADRIVLYEIDRSVVSIDTAANCVSSLILRFEEPVGRARLAGPVERFYKRTIIYR